MTLTSRSLSKGISKNENPIWITGAEALMDSLKIHGVKVIFGYPGGAILPIYDAVHKAEQDGWLNESWSEKGEIGELKRAYKGWNKKIETLLQHADPNTLYKWALHDRLPMKQWSKGRIVVLGDAAHPMLPFLAQGAAMAIEDGAVLANCIDNFDEVEEALKYFEKIRKPRTSYVQSAARRNAKVLHLSGFAAILRNLVMGYIGNKIFKKLDDFTGQDRHLEDDASIVIFQLK